MSKNAILYCRVSTDEQAVKGFSLRDQEERLKSYCANNEINIVRVYREDHSAKSFVRPEFTNLYEFLRSPANKIDLLIFLKWDRFSRNAPEAYEMLRKLTKLGIKAIATEQPIDLSVPEQKFMLALYLTAPEVENDRRSINVKQGMRRARLEGKWPGRAPIGYTNKRDESNRPIIVPNENAKYIKKAFEELDLNRYPIDHIRLNLVKQGLKCSNSNFHDIIKNPLYMGKIYVEAYDEHPAQMIDGMHSPLISSQLFYRVQEILAGRRRKNAHPMVHSIHEMFPLRGILECPECGRKLTGSGSRGNGGRFFYYHCSKGCKVRFRAELANGAVGKIIAQIKVEPAFNDLYKDVVKDFLTSNGQSQESQQRSIFKKVEILKTRITNLENKYADNEISSIDFNKMKGRFLNELMGLESQHKEMSIISKDLVKQLEYCMDTISDIGKMYSNADVSVKREIVGSIFPKSIVYLNKKVRTLRMNEVIKLLCPSMQAYEKKNSGQKTEKSALSAMVHRTGMDGGSQLHSLFSDKSN